MGFGIAVHATAIKETIDLLDAQPDPGYSAAHLRSSPPKPSQNHAHGAPEHPGALKMTRKPATKNDQRHQGREQAKEDADHPDGHPSPGEKTQQVSQSEPCRGSASRSAAAASSSIME